MGQNITGNQCQRVVRRWGPILQHYAIDAFGFDASTGEYGNLYELGIIDPTKVTRSALQNAASVATVLLSTEALVTDLPAEDEEDGAHDHGEFGDEW